MLKFLSATVAISQITVYANPTISVNSGSICLGDVFTISPSGADSYTISGGSATVSPAANTVYSVTGISTAGCPATNTVTSSLTVAPLPTLSASNGTICSGENFTISPSGGQTYHYSGGTAIVSPVTHTVYTVSGTSSVGCLSANTLTVSVTVNLSPTITVNSGSVCAGDTFTIIPSGTVSYSFEGGASVVTPSVTGSYTVSGQSAEGCISSNTAVSTVTVFALPNLSVNNGAVCAGEVFTLNPSGAISYSFSSGSATLSPATTNTYLISGSNAAGCVASIIATVQVNSLPAVTAHASSTSVCSGQSLTLYGGGAQSYTWSGGISNNVAFYPSATSLYTVTGVSTQSCVKSETVLVTVLLSPSVFVTSSRDTLCVGEPLTLSASGADSYHWNSGALGDTITVVAGPPSYTVTGSSAEGCSSTATLSVFVDECTGISTTVRSSDIVIYPNPGQGVFYIKSDGKVYVQVINSLGQEVFGGSISMDYSELDLQQQAKGIYFIRIYKGLQLVQTDKLIITK